MGDAVLRLATRRSQLAMWQAHHVGALLMAAHPGLVVELVPVSTEGDRRTDVPLSEIGGKGVFATEVQAALFDGRADVAVHSAKDLPGVTDPRLRLAAVPERGDPRDALVGGHLDQLPHGGVVATGSARRRTQLASVRDDLHFAEIRGNMSTRLAKAAAFDAIVVAAVALERLELGHHIREVLEPEVMLPQVGQAALAVECRAEDASVAELLGAIEHGPSRRCVDAERAVLAELGGDCSLPVAGFAQLDGGDAGPDGQIVLRAMLADRIGGTVVRDERRGADPEALGTAAAIEMRSRLAS